MNVSLPLGDATSRFYAIWELNPHPLAPAKRASLLSGKRKI